MPYSQPQYDERDKHGKELATKFDKMISGGTISLQSESHDRVPVIL